VTSGDTLLEKLGDFLRISDAAAYLGVSPKTLRNWENAAKITAYRHPINGYRLFKPDELDALLAKLQVDSSNGMQAQKMDS